MAGRPAQACQAGSNPELLATVRQDGSLVWVNDTWGRAFALEGLEEGMDPGGRFQDMVDPRDRAEIVHALHRLATGDEAVRVVTRCPWASGHFRVAWRLWLGEEPQSIHVSGRTEPGAHPSEYSGAVAAVLDHLDEAFYALDAEGRFLHLNDAAELALHRRRQELIGKRMWQVLCSPGIDEVRQRLEAVSAHRQPQTFEFHDSVHDRRYRLRAFPTDSGVAVYFRNIDVERRMVEHLKRAQRLESIGSLAGAIAHDFNNLLTLVTGHAELLREGDRDPGRNIAVIIDAAQRATQLTRKLLSFSRQQPPCPVPLDLNATVAGLEPILRRLVSANIRLVTRHADDVAAVVAEPGQIDQILINLVINARDAMPDGGALEIETARARIEAPDPARDDVPAGDYTLLSVRDSGVGMRPEILARLFEPFFTTKSDGTGLGMPTVYGIVEQCGGHLRVSSRTGQGTTVRVYFPDRGAGPGPAPSATSPRHAGASASVRPGGRPELQDPAFRRARRPRHR